MSCFYKRKKILNLFRFKLIIGQLIYLEKILFTQQFESSLYIILCPIYNFQFDSNYLWYWSYEIFQINIINFNFKEESKYQIFARFKNKKWKKKRVFNLEIKLKTFREGNKRFARSNYRSVIPYRRDYGCWLLLVYFIAYCAAALPL